MTDLLAMLGDEWAPATVVVPCSSEDRLDATHGCRSCGRAPTKWNDVYGGYVDGMGRLTRCGYCHSCVGSGRTSVRDPWTDELLDWRGAPCRYCAGTGWINHAWDCGPDRHQHHMQIDPGSWAGDGVGSHVRRAHRIARANKPKNQEQG